MEVCSRNHEEIVHDNGYDSCPLCEKIKEIERLESHIQDLKDDHESEISDLKDEIEDLNIQLNKND